MQAWARLALYFIDDVLPSSFFVYNIYFSLPLSKSKKHMLFQLPMNYFTQKSYKTPAWGTTGTWVHYNSILYSTNICSDQYLQSKFSTCTHYIVLPQTPHKATISTLVWSPIISWVQDATHISQLKLHTQENISKFICVFFQDEVWHYTSSFKPNHWQCLMHDSLRQT